MREPRIGLATVVARHRDVGKLMALICCSPSNDGRTRPWARAILVTVHRFHSRTGCPVED